MESNLILYSYIRSAEDGFKLRFRFLKLTCFRKAQVQIMEVSVGTERRHSLSSLLREQVFTAEGNEREGDESVRPSMRPSSF